ncbi:hypothetical protein N9O57_00390 [bacterium]|nr:hypothetical protein [bacterium]
MHCFLMRILIVMNLSLVLASSAFSGSKDFRYFKTKNEFSKFHQNLTDLFIEIEKNETYAKLDLRGQKSILHYFFNFNAYAIDQKICFFGGWPSIKVGSKCKRPWEVDHYRELAKFNPRYDRRFSCGGSDKFRCNPILFGAGSDGKGHCITASSFSNVTKSCSQVGQGNIGEIYNRILDDKAFRDNYLFYASNMNEFCDLNKDYSACAPLLGDIKSHIEAICSSDKELKGLLGLNKFQSLARDFGIISKKSGNDTTVAPVSKIIRPSGIRLGDDFTVSSFQSGDESKFSCEESERKLIYDYEGKPLSKVCPEFIDILGKHGLGKLRDGRTVEFFDSFQGENGEYKLQFVVAPENCAFGISNSGDCLEPYKSVVVDESMNLVPGDTIHLEAYKGLMVGGIPHDGNFVVAGINNLENDKEVKVFIGHDEKESSGLTQIDPAKKLKLVKVDPINLNPAQVITATNDSNVGQNPSISTNDPGQSSDNSLRTPSAPSVEQPTAPIVAPSAPILSSSSNGASERPDNSVPSVIDEDGPIIISPPVVSAPVLPPPPVLAPVPAPIAVPVPTVPALNLEFNKLSSGGWKGEWTDHIFTGIKSDSLLLKSGNSEVLSFCPRFDDMEVDEQKTFWAHFFKAVASIESEFNPRQGMFESGDEHTKGDLMMNRVLGKKVEKTSEGLLQLSYQDANPSKEWGNECIFDLQGDAKNYVKLSRARVKRGGSSSMRDLVNEGYLSKEDERQLSNMSIHDPKMNLHCGIKVLEKQLSRGRGIVSPISYWSVLRPDNKKSYKKFLENFSPKNQFCSKSYKGSRTSAPPQVARPSVNTAPTGPKPASVNIPSDFKVHLSEEEKKQMSKKVGEFEFNNKRDKIMQWNKNEDFLSLGLGHFTWFGNATKTRGVESFPDYIEYLVNEKGYDPEKIPQIIRPVKINGRYVMNKKMPYGYKSSFEKNQKGPSMSAVKNFLWQPDVQATQFDFIKNRLESQAGNIVNFHNSPSYDGSPVANGKELTRKMTNFMDDLSKSSAGKFGMIDYVNFKGEGLSPDERIKGTNEGWGLYQVLSGAAKEYDGSQDPAKLFSKHSGLALKNRVNKDSRMQANDAGWQRRTKFYGNPSGPIANLRPATSSASSSPVSSDPVNNSVVPDRVRRDEPNISALSSDQPFVNEGKMAWEGRFPEIDCATWGLNSSKFCFPEPGRIVLDAGHDSSSASRRGNRNDGAGGKYFHEGRMNMATTLVLKASIDKCLVRNRKPVVKMSRWPGDTEFGKNEFGVNKGAIRSDIKFENGARKKYVNGYLLGNNGVMSRSIADKSLVISMHYNCALNNHKHNDRSEVHIRKNKKPTQLVSSIQKSLVNEMSEHLKGLGSKNKVDLNYYKKYTSDTRFNNWAILGSGSSKTETMLIEGFFMDGAIGELTGKNMHSNNPSKHYPFQMRKKIYKNGKWTDGKLIDPSYRLTDEHVTVAKSVAKGIAKNPAYQCK